MGYILIKGNKIAGQTSSLQKAKKWANETEKKYRTNCFIAKEMRR